MSFQYYNAELPLDLSTLKSFLMVILLLPQELMKVFFSQLPPITAEQKLARKNELKAHGTLLMALPNKHKLKFNSHKDAKTLMQAIEKRFGGNTETKKRNKTDLEEQSLDDLFNSLKIYEAEVKSSSTGTTTQNIAFVSSSNTDSTTEPVSAAASVSAVCAKMLVSSLPNVDSLRRNLRANRPTSLGFDMSKVECYNCHRKGHFARKCRSPKDSRRNGSYDWSFQAEEEPANYALMAFSSSSSSFDNKRVMKVAPSSLYDRFQSGDGYHVVPPPYTGTFMPPKPNLVFNNGPNGIKTDHSTFTVKLSPTKPDQDLSNTIKSSAPIIKDWVSYSEDESETKALQIVPSFVQSIEHVKSPRHSIQHVETYILAATPTPASPKPTSNVFTQSKPVHITAVRPVSTDVPKLMVTRPKQVKPIVTKTKSPIKRHINCSPSLKASNSPPRVTAVQASVGNPQYALKDKGVIDSGCSRHMTGNMSYLSNFEELNDGYVAFEGNPKGGKIFGKGKIKTGNVLFIDTESLVLSPEFKLPDESQVLLRVPRENNMCNVNLKNIVPSRELTCLFAKATIDESNLWHRRLDHINFKTMNKLVKGNLIRGLPTKVFKNDNTCVACKKGKQHRASCKTKPVSSVDQHLSRLHMDLFRPTFVKSINKKSYCQVFIDDYSSDNGTEFKNNDLNQFCRMKGIKREFSVPRTPQQNGIAEKKNKTLIEAARTMLVDSLLPIPLWAEAVNTACYVQNRVLVTKPHSKTPYELLHGRTPSIGFIRPFGCPVTILNTLDSLCKFDGKVDEGFLVGYIISSKAFRVFNSRTRIIQETLHANFLENKPNVVGSGPTWLFDIDSLTKTMNYQPVTSGNQCNPSAGFQDNFDAEKAGEEIDQQYVLFPVWSSGFTNPKNFDRDATVDGKEPDFDAKKPDSKVIVSPSSSAQLKKQEDKTKREAKGKSHVESFTGYRDLSVEFEDCSDNNINEVNATELEDITYSDNEDDVGTEADFNNLEKSIIVSPIQTTRVHKDHHVTQLIGDLSSATQIRSMTRVAKDQEWEQQEELRKGFKRRDYYSSSYDAREIWMAVKARFGGNKESKKMRKTMLKQEFSEFSVFEEEGLHKCYDRALAPSWSQVALTLKTRGGLEYLSFDDLYNKLRYLEINVKGGSSYGSRSTTVALTHSAFIGVASTNTKMVYFDHPSYSSSITYTSDHSGSIIEDVLYLFVVENEPTQQLAYEDFEQVDQLEMEELDIKWQMAMLPLRINKFQKKAGRKINFNNKDSARFDRRKARCYNCLQLGHFVRECNVKKNEHKAENMTKEGEQVYGLMAGFESNFTDHAGNAAGSVYNAVEFAMMGISPKVQTCPFGCDYQLSELKKNYAHLEKLDNDSFIQVQAYKNTVKTLELQKDWYHNTQLALEEKVRILSANLKNTTNTLKYSETLYDQDKIEKKEWEVKFVESLARFDKWKESSKNLAKLKYSSMSTRTKLGLGFKEYIRLDEVFDLSTPSVFDPEPENREVKSIYEWFVKAGRMHEVPPHITGTFMPTLYKSDLEGTHATFGSKFNTSSINTSDSNDFVFCDNSDKSSALETYDFASCVSSPKTNDSFFTVDVKILPKSDVKDPSPTNGFPSCSFKENVKPPRNLCNKSWKADRIHCKNNFVCTKKCFVCGSKSHLIKDCNVYDTVDNFPSVILKAAYVLAGSRNSLASTSTCRSIPTVSRNRPASIHTGRHIPTGRVLLLSPQQVVLGDITDLICNGGPRTMVDLINLHGFILNDPQGMLNMTGNKEKLDDFVQVKGGTVTFGDGDGKITEKGTIRTSKLNFENVYNVEELQHFNLFSWAFFLGTKDETFYILKDFIDLIENQLNKKVKTIRYDNRTEFQNVKLIDLCEDKGIKRDYSNARTPQQNGVTERKNRILIEATQSMLADSKLPTMFWTEAVSTAYYALNRVLITNPHNKTPYELLYGKVPNIRHLKHFGCQVTILNTSDHLGKFKGKANDGFLVGYAANSTQDTNINAGTKDDDSKSECDEQAILVPSFPSSSFLGPKVNDVFAPIENNLDYAEELARLQRQEHEAHSAIVKYRFEFSNETTEMLHQAEIKTRRNLVLDDGDPAGSIVSTGGVPADSVPTGSVPASHVPTSSVPARSVPASNVPVGGVLAGSIDSASFGDPTTSESVPAVFTPDHAANSTLPPGHSLGSSEHSTRFPSPSDLGNHQHTAVIFSSSSYDDDFCADVTNLALSVAVDPVATKRVNTIHPQSLIIRALQSPIQTRSTVQKSKFGESAFISYQVWKLVPLPDEKIAIKTKWILKNKRDARGIVVRNKARLVAQGHRQEEGIDYDKVFAPVARIEAIRLFLAFASYMGFMVYQMDVKSAFLYGEIEEEVYVTQPKGFEDPHNPKHVYRVVKAFYGLHQAPRSWHIILVQVYVDDIIFGSTNKAWCDEFEVLMKGEFEMSAMDKYVKDMLKKFDMESVITTTTPYEVLKPKSKDELDDAINVHLYRSMIGSLVYLTTSRPDIMFVVSACSRHHVTPMTSHLNAVKKIFKYLKGQPNLGLWYPQDSPFQLEAYSDSDYAWSHGDRKSTTGGCQFLGRRLISWQCKKQTVVATSSTEAEYVAVASCRGQASNAAGSTGVPVGGTGSC
nr:hypothetical protein [Tanacetum cinerariifolium]